MKLRKFVAWMGIGALFLILFKTISQSEKKTTLADFVELDANIPINLSSENLLEPLAKSILDITSDSLSDKAPIVGIAIDKIESDLKSRDAIQRLNADTVEPKERNQLGNQFLSLTRLRAQELEQQLQEIERTVANLSANHLPRLKAFGAVP